MLLFIAYNYVLLCFTCEFICGNCGMGFGVLLCCYGYCL